ncbi:Brain tumor protein [Dirofilaria immitis]|nr:Brain tumor protein [Dirofilaria immitis]
MLDWWEIDDLTCDAISPVLIENYMIVTCAVIRIDVLKTACWKFSSLRIAVDIYVVLVWYQAAKDFDLKEVVKCPLCLEPYREPKVLACFHSFCKSCLERQMDDNCAEKIVCPQCRVETQLSVQLEDDKLRFGLVSIIIMMLDFLICTATLLKLMNISTYFVTGNELDRLNNVSLAVEEKVFADGIESLLTDYGLESVMIRQNLADDKGLIFGSPSSTSSSPPLIEPASYDQNSNKNSSCTGCKSGELASAFCQDCAHFCVPIGHRVDQLSQEDAAALAAAFAEKTACKCIQHRSQPLRYFCLTCNLAICMECTQVDHVQPTHQYELISDVADKQMAIMETLVQDARLKHSELLETYKVVLYLVPTMVDAAQNRLSCSLTRAHQNVDDATQTLIRMIEDNRRQIIKDLDNAYGAKQLQLTVIDKRTPYSIRRQYPKTHIFMFVHIFIWPFLEQHSVELITTDVKVQQMAEKLAQTIEFTSRLVKYAAPTEVMVFKQLLHTRLQVYFSFNPDSNNILQTTCELDFPPLNPNVARQQIISIMGLVRGASEWSQGTMSSANTGMPPAPIGRPASRQLTRPVAATNSTLPISNFSDSSLMRPKNEYGGSSQSLGTFVTVDNGFSNQYEKWSMGLEPASGLQLAESPDLELEKNMGISNLYPPRAQIKRQKMIYHCKFGEFGVMEGQFTEPSGVAVNAQNDIIVADTNNHRIQVFDKEGRFKFQFGECGKRDGQLLYPNRVAVNRLTGDFIVTERSPTHQIQIYNQYGQFLRKFGANILQHPRGVCVDSKGRIIVIECKGNVSAFILLHFQQLSLAIDYLHVLGKEFGVMRVIIFDMFGNILQKFSCSRYLEFPNGVCTNHKQEILISDNRAHCIKVFNYDGQFVRQIGGEGITNYPIGVGINYAGDVVVADNHNNFNLTVFSQITSNLNPRNSYKSKECQDGTMISALESKVKHAQCFDVALVEDGSVVLASKDYRLYLYRYQSSGTTTAGAATTTNSPK